MFFKKIVFLLFISFIQIHCDEEKDQPETFEIFSIDSPDSPESRVLEIVDTVVKSSDTVVKSPDTVVKSPDTVVKSPDTVKTQINNHLRIPLQRDKEVNEKAIQDFLDTLTPEDYLKPYDPLEKPAVVEEVEHTHETQLKGELDELKKDIQDTSELIGTIITEVNAKENKVPEKSVPIQLTKDFENTLQSKKNDLYKKYIEKELIEMPKKEKDLNGHNKKSIPTSSFPTATPTSYKPTSEPSPSYVQPNNEPTNMQPTSPLRVTPNIQTTLEPTMETTFRTTSDEPTEGPTIKKTDASIVSILDNTLEPSSKPKNPILEPKPTKKDCPWWWPFC